MQAILSMDKYYMLMEVVILDTFKTVKNMESTVNTFIQMEISLWVNSSEIGSSKELIQVKMGLCILGSFS